MLKNETKTEVVPEVRPTVRARAYGFLMRHPRLAAVVMAFAALFGGPVAAHASTTTDQTGTSSLFTQAHDQIAQILIPAVVTIVLVASLFWLGVSWYQKGKNKGGR